MRAMSVATHFVKCEDAVRSTYERILDTSRALGPVKEDAKKTSIHLVRRTAFAGIATRKAALILTVKSARDLKSARIIKSEQTSANRWHHEIKLTDPKQIDRQLTDWIKAAYELAE
jgi:hypothetical protein